MPDAVEGWVVVSGGGGALGRHIVAGFAAKGRDVLALDQRFDEATDWPMTVRTHLADLAAPEAVKAALATVGRIALLVNAVGFIYNEPVLNLRGGKLAPHGIDRWHRVIAANLTAPFVVASETAARMARTGGGVIVNFSSIAAGGNAGQVAYAAAKAGIESMTKTMAAELAPLGIRSNAVALGFIEASTTHAALDEHKIGQYVERTPLGRLGSMDEVLDAISFLAGNDFANGAILAIDGGLKL